MFKNLEDMLKKYEEGIKVPIQIPIDEKGFLDKKCPSDNCGADFKVLFEDWKQKVRQDKVYCPVCRFEKPATEWNTPEQSEFMIKAAVNQFDKDFKMAIQKEIKNFNRRMQTKFIKMSLSYKPAKSFIMLPPEASETLRQEYVCEQCGCKYSIVGTAYFCPACGYKNPSSNFVQELNKTEGYISNITKIRKAFTKVFDLEDAQQRILTTLEDSLYRIVSIFQVFAESKFRQLQSASKFRIRKNIFQNLAESSELWKKAIGKGYEDILTENELHILNKYFQQRHLLAHKNGIVDEEYLEKSGDHSYQRGQRIVVKPNNIQELIALIRKLAKEVEKWQKILIKAI